MLRGLPWGPAALQHRPPGTAGTGTGQGQPQKLPPYPALQGVAGLQVGRAGAVALLQLSDAVPVVQLLRLVLARPQVDAAPA